MTDNRYGKAPLGKSVEEVASETGNRAQPASEGEAVRATQDRIQDKVIPAIANSNATAAPAVINPDALAADAVLDSDSGPDSSDTSGGR